MITPDQVSVRSDGICIYLVITVKNSLFSRVLLLLYNAVGLAAILVSLIAWLPALLLVGVLMELVIARYTLWNLFGREMVTVNTKVLTYRHDYGLFATRPVTRTVNKMLHCQAHSTIRAKDGSWQYLTFGSYDSNDLPCLLYQVTLPVEEKDTLYIQQLIDKLYVTRLAEEQAFSVVHLN